MLASWSGLTRELKDLDIQTRKWLSMLHGAFHKKSTVHVDYILKGNDGVVEG